MNIIFDAVIPVLDLFVAFYIPIRIDRNQSYTALLSDYRSHDFAAAVQGVIDFFTVDCGSDFSRIGEQYERRYREEVGMSPQEVLAARSNFPENSRILHYQRRMLNSFFYQLDLCARQGFLWRRRIRRDFTASEANIIRIIIYMNKAVDENPNIFKDISGYAHVPSPRHTKGMSAYLSDLYGLLRTSSRYIKH